MNGDTKELDFQRLLLEHNNVYFLLSLKVWTQESMMARDVDSVQLWAYKWLEDDRRKVQWEVGDNTEHRLEHTLQEVDMVFEYAREVIRQSPEDWDPTYFDRSCFIAWDAKGEREAVRVNCEMLNSETLKELLSEAKT